MDDNRFIQTNEAVNFAIEYKMSYIETSAKNNLNIVELFRLAIVDTLVTDKEDELNQISPIKVDSDDLNNRSNLSLSKSFNEISYNIDSENFDIKSKIPTTNFFPELNNINNQLEEDTIYEDNCLSIKESSKVKNNIQNEVLKLE